MTVPVASIGCERKAASGLPAWPALFDLMGDYTLYLNFEAANIDSNNEVRAFQVVREQMMARLREKPERGPQQVSYDVWTLRTRLGADWYPRPSFDQDQARLTSIVTARNMCLDYALITGASHLLFIDSDVIPPKNVIPALLALEWPLVGGIVPGRGCHKDLKYIFGEERNFDAAGTSVIEVRHGTCGCMMIERKVFDRIRFRFSVAQGLSEDPAYALDVRDAFGKKMWLRKDVICQHIGDLAPTELSQF